MKLLVIHGFSEKFDNANWVCLRELLQALKAYPDVSVKITGDILNKDMEAVSLKTPLLYAKKMIRIMRNRFKKWLSGDWIVKIYRKNTLEYSTKCIHDVFGQTKGEKV